MRRHFLRRAQAAPACARAMALALLEAAEKFRQRAVEQGIFFIVTAVCALYMQTAENNVRNYLIARDYKSRRREYDALARSGQQ